MADTAAQIKKQVEFYFGDSNFPKDKHLQIQAKLSPEGFVPIAHLLTFKRLQQLTQDPAVVIAALEGSTVVGFNEAKDAVKRIAPIPEDNASLPRQIYTKGWGKEATLEELTEFYSAHGTVLAVRVRKNKGGEAKGSALIEFDTEETAKKVLEAKPQKEGKVVIYQPALEWVQEKREEAQKNTKEKKEKRQQEKKEKEETDNKPEFVKGCVVKFEGVGAGMDRESLQPIFSAYGTIKYTDFKREETDGFIRFAAPEEAAKAVAEITAQKLELAGKIPTLSVLTGVAEDEYIKASLEKRNEKYGGGGRGEKRKDRNDGERESKKTKVDE